MIENIYKYNITALRKPRKFILHIIYVVYDDNLFPEEAKPRLKVKIIVFNYSLMESPILNKYLKICGSPGLLL